MSCASLPPSAATAAFASRAETPMRKPPVTSLISAQRPVSSSASSQRASCCGSCALPSVESVSMTAVRVSSSALLPLVGRGQGWGSGGDSQASTPVRRLPTRCPDPPPQGGRREARPHQRDGLGEIADIIVGQFEQHRIGALGDQAADQAGLGVRKAQRAGQRGERPAALGIGRRAEIIGDQPQLVVARRLVGEAVQKFGEAVHASASPPSDSPLSSSSP